MVVLAFLPLSLDLLCRPAAWSMMLLSTMTSGALFSGRKRWMEKERKRKKDLMNESTFYRSCFLFLPSMSTRVWDRRDEGCWSMKGFSCCRCFMATMYSSGSRRRSFNRSKNKEQAIVSRRWLNKAITNMARRKKTKTNAGFPGAAKQRASCLRSGRFGLSGRERVGRAFSALGA